MECLEVLDVSDEGDLRRLEIRADPSVLSLEVPEHLDVGLVILVTLFIFRVYLFLIRDQIPLHLALRRLCATQGLAPVHITEASHLLQILVVEGVL